MASKVAEGVIDRLEQSLAELPDAPAWSLKAEMLKQSDNSRIAEGAFSQPLCTAVQIMLVDILNESGITFNTVVGHSSGEIAAAYAAGFLSARDAIRIAYYRGVFAKFAGANGQPGGMLAAGTSVEDAQELCSLPKFSGKLQVAASNSSASVTLSGDLDAVEHAEIVFKDEQKFARMLKVDTAYHSHHMQPCSDPYLKAMKACNIEVQTPPESSSCRWYSSVFGGKEMKVCEELKDIYWRDNMLKPVLFSPALQRALANGAIPAAAIEVGPHPALKGPASLTIEESIGNGIPYSGTLSRGANDTEALADTLGFLWNLFATSRVNFDKYEKLFCDSPDHRLLKGLPSYAWDHERAYWYESRQSRVSRMRTETPHELLGTLSSECGEGEYHWRNYIKPNEIPWLNGHKVQGQMLFPGAGFASMALEASKVLTGSDQIRLIEIQDLIVSRAIGFNDEVEGVETTFGLSNITVENMGVDKYISADFACYACLNKDSGALMPTADGKLKISVGTPSLDALPGRSSSIYPMQDVDVDAFYSSLESTGYLYTGLFRGITSLKRATDAASGVILSTGESNENGLMLHPATLDVAFQSIFAAVGYPGDGRLWSLHVPTLLKRIRVNPFACPPNGGLGSEVSFQAALTVSESAGICGDVDIFASGGDAMVQVEGLVVSPLSAPGPKDDRLIFAETVWDIAEPDAEIIYKPWILSDVEKVGADYVERVCFFYMRNLIQTITPEERDKCDWHKLRVLEWAEHVVAETAKGKYPTCSMEWMDDTHEFILRKVKE